MIQESLKVENTQANSRPTVTNLVREDTRHSVANTLCVLRYIIKYRWQIKTAIK